MSRAGIFMIILYREGARLVISDERVFENLSTIIGKRSMGLLRICIVTLKAGIVLFTVSIIEL